MKEDINCWGKRRPGKEPEIEQQTARQTNKTEKLLTFEHQKDTKTNQCKMWFGQERRTAAKQETTTWLKAEIKNYSKVTEWSIKKKSKSRLLQVERKQSSQKIQSESARKKERPGKKPEIEKQQTARN